MNRVGVGLWTFVTKFVVVLAELRLTAAGYEDKCTSASIKRALRGRAACVSGLNKPERLCPSRQWKGCIGTR
jgi:hypothetical protein